MIVIQHIETYWTKQSRGMPGAAVRNAVPRALPLPALPATAGLAVHKVRAREDAAFELQTETETAAGKYWSLSFKENDAGLTVWFTYNRLQHGQPPRRTGRWPLFTLAPGQWGALHINGRHSGYFGQFYTSHFVNVAYRPVAPLTDTFTGREPDYFVDEMADLF